MNDVKVSGILIIHNDSSLLEYAIESAKPYIDELVVVDGAYKWVAPFCSELNESPNESTDDLMSKLERCGVPVKYFKGVWESETHKRKFSLEQASYDYMMLIDSDEVFELDSDLVGKFLESEQAIGECYFPLYFDKNIVGYSTGLKSPPLKEIFLNKKHYSVQALVNSLFLLVPDGERGERISNKDRFKENLGVVHHLSLFRTDNSGYRRSRFYNLLAMRVAKKLTLLNGLEFGSDEEFYSLLLELADEKITALNSLFEFHRITAAFPAIKSNQYLSEFASSSDEVKSLIAELFDRMLIEQSRLLRSREGKEFSVFANKSLFVDVTSIIGREFEVVCDASPSVVAHIESDCSRDEIDIQFESKNDKWVCVLPLVACRRMVLEIVPLHSSNGVIEFSYHCD